MAHDPTMCNARDPFARSFRPFDMNANQHTTFSAHFISTTSYLQRMLPSTSADGNEYLNNRLAFQHQVTFGSQHTLHFFGNLQQYFHSVGGPSSYILLYVQYLSGNKRSRHNLASRQKAQVSGITGVYGEATQYLIFHIVNSYFFTRSKQKSYAVTHVQFTANRTVRTLNPRRH
jgi:hypothetical protein